MIADDALRLMQDMRERGELPHTVSFSHRGWDRVRSEVAPGNDLFTYDGGRPKTFLGLPYRVDREQDERVMVLTREQLERKYA